MERILILEGTWEEIKQHEAEFAGQYLRVIVRPKAPRSLAKNAEVTEKPSVRVSAMGKCAGVLNSEDFLRRKQEEIDGLTAKKRASS